MNRFARHVLIAELVRAMRDAGSWCGRTHIQKTLYSFQTLFHPGGEWEVRYILYKHGPYSFALDEDLAEMEFYGGLAREQHRCSAARYEPGEGARALRERFGAGVEAWLPQLQFVAQRVGARNPRELEALSLLMFLATDSQECLQHSNEQARLSRVHELKPHLTDTEVRRAQHEYLSLLDTASQFSVC
jgi:hypothetical protein